MTALEYIGHTLIGFHDSSYRWISVKRFTWDCEADDKAVLAGLVGHSRYRDTFLSPDSHEQDAGDIHGPYRLAAITAQAFDPTGPEGAVSAVEEFCGLYELPPQPEVRREIASVVLSRLADSSCFRLRDLPDAVHDFGSVLWEFRELAAISQQDQTALSIVMAID